MLAFDLPKAKIKNLAGFSIRCEPEGQEPYFLLNTLQFKTPSDHAHDAQEPMGSSLNAPIQRFRWLHVPGSVHQGIAPFFGKYTYTVTPRYFDESGSMLPLDSSLSQSKTVEVAPFEKKGVALGFTRGYKQSQAFVHHFGLKAKIQPTKGELLFDTSELSGTNAAGEQFTYAQEYEWLGYTARQRIFELLSEVAQDKSLRLDVFAYDMSEPDIMKALLALGKQGRVRIILDNAALHVSDSKGPSPEDKFEQAFRKAAKKPPAIKRGKFGRYAHDKVLIVSKLGAGQKLKPVKVLTGSTNFSVTGLYVNSNHVLVFSDPTVAAKYAEVFELVWQTDVSRGAFLKSPLSTQTAQFSSAKTPPTEITFSPHSPDVAQQILDDVVTRIEKEKGATGSVLFAVMETGTASSGPLIPALRELHEQQDVFSFGISDSNDGVTLYEPGKRTGVLVTGKPGKATLPAPFDQVPGVGLGHQIHHKFVVCGFNGPAPVVYCGSSNLALGGEEQNGDNLLAIRDAEIATVFAIEALALVDHFQFLDRAATKKKEPSNKSDAATRAHWFLFTNGKWAESYYEKDDLHFRDRVLFTKE